MSHLQSIETRRRQTSYPPSPIQRHRNKLAKKLHEQLELAKESVPNGTPVLRRLWGIIVTICLDEYFYDLKLWPLSIIDLLGDLTIP